MRQTAPARTSADRVRKSRAFFLVVLIAAIAGALACQSASSSASSIDVTASPSAIVTERQPASMRPSPSQALHEDRGRTTTAQVAPVADDDGAVTGEDGLVPDGVTVFDDAYPGVSNLKPDLLKALREAATDAADDGIELDINSGWRSPEYQDQLLREAVSRYGSAKAAARWVGTADTSAHVSGDAVDIGPYRATTWLSEHGAQYGLCQVYRNETWHYELRPDASSRGCPPMYADPTEDPRMRQ